MVLDFFMCRDFCFILYERTLSYFELTLEEAVVL